MVDKIDKIFNQNKPMMAVNVAGLEKHFFYHGPGIQRKWIETNKALLNFVASKYGQSVKVSLEVREMVVTEVNKSLLRKFKTKKEKTDYLATLEFWEKEEYEVVRDDYNKFSRVIRKDLLVVYGVMLSMCYISVVNYLETEDNYQKMNESKRFNAMTLYSLIKKIYNGSTLVIVEDMIDNVLEVLYNFVLIRGEEYDSLAKYLEASEHRFSLLQQVGLDLATETLWD